MLFKDGVTKRELVTFFLAILELTKEREILLKQETRFKEIYVFKREENSIITEDNKKEKYLNIANKSLKKSANLGYEKAINKLK